MHDRGGDRTYARMVLYEGGEAEVASGLAYRRRRTSRGEVWCVAGVGDAPPTGRWGRSTAFALPLKVVDALFTFRRRMLRAAEGREGGERRRQSRPERTYAEHLWYIEDD